MRSFAFVTVLALSILGTKAFADSSWGLPIDLSDKNTKVTFDVDTTWHVVYGKTSNVSGSISLVDPKNLMSIKSDIHFPVKSFDTGWGLRNTSLYEHMQAETYPEVVLKVSELPGACTPAVVAGGPCKGTLKASLTICDVTKEVPLEVTIEDKGANYVVNGAYAFKWAEYNVKDPSIVAASVDPTVRVQYSVEVPKSADVSK